MSGTEASKLTPEQLVNWRDVLVQTIGSYALIMPDEEIQAMCDRMNYLAAQQREGEQDEQDFLWDMFVRPLVWLYHRILGLFRRRLAKERGGKHAR